jgi:hypothetical protein
VVRRALVGAAVLAAALAGAAVAVVVLGGRAGGETLPQPTGTVATARAAVEPGTHLFGDAVSARVDVVLDRGRVDPAALRLDADFAPYQPVGPVQVERRDAGGLTHIRYTVPLRCLISECVPSEAKQAFTFAPATVVASGRPVVRFEWPPVEVTSRLNQSQLVREEAVLQLDWRANMTELPPVTYRVRPVAAAAGLAGLAGLLAAAGAGLLVVGLRRPPRRRPLELLPPLERSLALLAAAERRADASEQRKALDLLAAELGRRGEDDLARTASELAWSRRAPAATASLPLTEQVHRMIEDGRNGGAP